jgi:SAM-dependent methyltransferase
MTAAPLAAFTLGRSRNPALDTIGRIFGADRHHNRATRPPSDTASQRAPVHDLSTLSAARSLFVGRDNTGQAGASTVPAMSALTPDYDSDPGRRGAWVAPRDVHDDVGPELRGPVLDVGCGEGRLFPRLRTGVAWVGIDASHQQTARCAFRPLVVGDMRRLPFGHNSFAEVVHLWCLYHLDDPVVAVLEARRVLRDGGRYYACTAARTNDPELMPEGYPATTFDAEEAVAIVASVFPNAHPEPWNDTFFPLETREEVRAYCRHHFIPVERAETVEVPLWLTKRGVLVRASKT